MQSCPRCQRTNPAEALFCYFDGAELGATNGAARSAQAASLPHEFVFPSGRRCRSFGELAQGCQEEWEVASGLLKQGVFHQFLAGAGRLDLARLAQSAAAKPDADAALDAFLAGLPVRVERTPRLDFSPRRIHLTQVHAGETKQIPFTVVNQGNGLLHGTLTVSDGDGWLLLTGSAGGNECKLHAARSQQVTLVINTRGLPAPQSYSAKLTVITNGGIAEVPVRLDLAAHPFPHAPFQDVGTPREMAERMRAQPKAAVTFLESGEVERWFGDNGWTYPVQGKTTRGVAAVQQFFEGMGLSRPPEVQADGDVDVSCLAPEVVTRQISLRTAAKKWVYASVESDVPWLRVLTPGVSGPRQAVVSFEIDSGQLGAHGEGRLRIVANAGQTLTVRVRARVHGTVPPRNGHDLRPAFVGAAAGLALRVLLAGPVDLLARVGWATAASPAPGTLAAWAEAPQADAGFVRHVVLATWWLGAVAGLFLMRRRGSRTSDTPFGAVAGGVAGFVLSATAACLVPFLDAPPRWLWGRLVGLVGTGSTTGWVWLWTPLWIVVAAACWAGLGAAAGVLLGWTGSPGRRILSRIAALLASCFRVFGLRRLAASLGVE